MILSWSLGLKRTRNSCWSFLLPLRTISAHTLSMFGSEVTCLVNSGTHSSIINSSTLLRLSLKYLCSKVKWASSIAEIRFPNCIESSGASLGRVTHAGKEKPKKMSSRAAIPNRIILSPIIPPLRILLLPYAHTSTNLQAEFVINDAINAKPPYRVPTN